MTERIHNTTAASYHVLRWLLAPVVALHNVEEWLTSPTFGDVGVGMAARFNLPLAPPTWEEMQLGLIFVTLIPALIVVWASFGRARPAKNLAVLWVAGIVLMNVFAPHVPAAFLVGGYTPGLLSALVISLPFCLLLFRAAIREHVLPAKTAILSGVLGAMSLPFVVIGVLALSRFLIAAGK